MRRMQVCEDMLLNIENDAELLTKVITGDETWVFKYDPDDEATEQAMAQPRLAKTEESVSVKVSNQSDADCIF